jgi:hypothetical protein
VVVTAEGEGEGGGGFILFKKINKKKKFFHLPPSFILYLSLEMAKSKIDLTMSKRKVYSIMLLTLFRPS